MTDVVDILPSSIQEFRNGTIIRHGVNNETAKVTLWWRPNDSHDDPKPHADSPFGSDHIRSIREEVAQLIDEEKVLSYWASFPGGRDAAVQTCAYHVFSVLDHRRETRRRLLKIQWVGYPSIEPHATWEPIRSILNAAREIVTDYLDTHCLTQDLRQKAAPKKSRAKKKSNGVARKKNVSLRRPRKQPKLSTPAVDDGYKAERMIAEGQTVEKLTAEVGALSHSLQTVTSTLEALQAKVDRLQRSSSVVPGPPAPASRLTDEDRAWVREMISVSTREAARDAASQAAREAVNGFLSSYLHPGASLSLETLAGVAALHGAVDRSMSGTSREYNRNPTPSATEPYRTAYQDSPRASRTDRLPFPYRLQTGRA
ncbi:hypothetical protein CSOJ01_09308 [Colletotrichum sojae]|uniref:Chromo domain-containing protein n=1 Tax=Colletotrichum sojae TaxID=2175907 RepID=A0A8H6J497_9PEZI|nr:hypothetical protein CSOJ01_09308 [Colletotrichum sojae]